ncbi:MAG TPA: hypothetical protein DHW80_10115, partial [Acinetobacter sp.]|uniref:hypothetical protein n=1 Tax=Acinetobacter variabilis TaxID=70346 RepID=UPI000EE6AA92
TTIKEAHLSESNYVLDGASESDIAKRKESLEKIKQALKKFKKDRQAFQENFEKLNNKLNK